jgi:hypothetical protein
MERNLAKMRQDPGGKNSETDEIAVRMRSATNKESKLGSKAETKVGCGRQTRQSVEACSFAALAISAVAVSSGRNEAWAFQHCGLWY